LIGFARSGGAGREGVEQLDAVFAAFRGVHCSERDERLVVVGALVQGQLRDAADGEVAQLQAVFVLGATGLEPATSWTQTRRSSQTELRPVALGIIPAVGRFGNTARSRPSCLDSPWGSSWPGKSPSRNRAFLHSTAGTEPGRRSFGGRSRNFTLGRLDTRSALAIKSDAPRDQVGGASLPRASQQVARQLVAAALLSPGKHLHELQNRPALHACRRPGVAGFCGDHLDRVRGLAVGRARRSSPDRARSAPTSTSCRSARHRKCRPALQDVPGSRLESPRAKVSADAALCPSQSALPTQPVAPAHPAHDIARAREGYRCA
jgi:hypothetical protein